MLPVPPYTAILSHESGPAPVDVAEFHIAYVMSGKLLVLSGSGAGGQYTLSGKKGTCRKDTGPNQEFSSDHFFNL
jgi:hypothetical protein